MIQNFSDQEIILDKSKPSIFLAGPTKRNSYYEESWRKDACNILSRFEFDGIVYIPEFSRGDNPFDFMNQVEWERQGLMNADVIVFFVPRKLPEMPGFTTNVEFGYYLAKRPGSVLLCCPNGYEKNRYLEWLYTRDNPDRMVFRYMLDVMGYAVGLSTSMKGVREVG